MIVGIGYTFVIEGFIANLPGQNPTLTVQYHLKSYLAGLAPEYAERMRDLIVEQRLAPAGDALEALALTTVVALALGCIVFSRRQYALAS
jgi:hypothetical protein